MAVGRVVRTIVGFGSLIALVLGCGDEPQPCTPIQLSPLTGDVYGRDGNAITPDRVTVSYNGGIEEECSIASGGSRFRCTEGHGTGVLTAYEGDAEVSKRFEVREDEDEPCHAAEQEVDLKFE